MASLTFVKYHHKKEMITKASFTKHGIETLKKRGFTAKQIKDVEQSMQRTAVAKAAATLADIAVSEAFK
jgi:hypothetical protein